MAEVKLTTPSTLQKGSYVMLEGVPCRVTDIQFSKPGKHGHAKYRISGAGLVDEKKRIVVMPGHDTVESPIVEKKTAQVLSVQGDVATVMDSESYETFEMKIPEELKATVKDGANVLYWILMDVKIMKQLKGSE